MERLVGKYIFDPEISAGKMLFLTGPRQVGKTTFAKKWLSSERVEDTYFDWDDPAVRSEYNRNPLFFRNIVNAKFKDRPVPMVFDEIHKQKNWRNILKGVYDPNRERVQLLVTGSARLGLYRKSGDSLVGRYFSFQIFPLGLPEVVSDFSWVLEEDRPLVDGESLLEHARKVNNRHVEEALEKLVTFGGFPEPLLKASVRFHRRWIKEYKTLLTREEVRDLSRISDIRGLEDLIDILPSKVGSPLSINSLREDLGYHHSTLVNWINIIKELYLVFTLRPWHRNILRSIRKESKLFFFDWSGLPDQGRRFENLMAVSLVRMAARFTEMGLGVFEVMYIRDKEKREDDFALIKDNKPTALFETKEGDSEISPSGRYFGKRLGIPLYQIVHGFGRCEAFPDNCFKIPASKLLMLTG
ncbi:MAG TPA: ATP-binding protein [Thermodesulfobacteriota bacterium]|nr:ATP-binding protein [Thermodesulfobacteriota bacterium]